MIITAENTNYPNPQPLVHPEFELIQSEDTVIIQAFSISEARQYQTFIHVAEEEEHEANRDRWQRPPNQALAFPITYSPPENPLLRVLSPQVSEENQEDTETKTRSCIKSIKLAFPRMVAGFKNVMLGKTEESKMKTNRHSPPESSIIVRIRSCMPFKPDVDNFH